MKFATGGYLPATAPGFHASHARHRWCVRPASQIPCLPKNFCHLSFLGEQRRWKFQHWHGEFDARTQKSRIVPGTSDDCSLTDENSEKQVNDRGENGSLFAFRLRPVERFFLDKSAFYFLSSLYKLLCVYWLQSMIISIAADVLRLEKHLLQWIRKNVNWFALIFEGMHIRSDFLDEQWWMDFSFSWNMLYESTG